MDTPILVEYFNQCLKSLEAQYTPETYSRIEVQSPVPFEHDPVQEYWLSALYHFFAEANRRNNKYFGSMNAAIDGGDQKLVFLFASPDPTNFENWQRALRKNAVTVLEDMSLHWDLHMEDGNLWYMHDNKDNLLTPLIAAAYAEKIFAATNEPPPPRIFIPENLIDRFLEPVGLSQDDLFSIPGDKKKFHFLRPNPPLLQRPSP